MECWSTVFLCRLWLQLYRKTKRACRVTAPALQFCATVTNTRSRPGCAITLHFCILAKPTHCSHVYPFSHTTRELSLTQNSVPALALENEWAVQWKVVLKGFHGFFQGHKVCWAPSSSAAIAKHPHLDAEVPPALMEEVSNLFQFLNGNIFEVVQPAEFTLH